MDLKTERIWPLATLFAKDIMAEPEVQCLWPGVATLGEGPLWLAHERALVFVDIKGKRVHRWREEDGARCSWGLSEMPGWLVPCADGKSLLAGLQSGIVALELDQPGRPGITLRWLHRLHAPGSHLRLNDAKADVHGNLWFGTMDHALEGRNPVGEFFRLDVHGNIRRFDCGYGVTNGPTFSLDGKTLYHTDSAARCIYAFDLDENGDLHNRRIWLQFDTQAGYPDGMTTDSEGCIWIAHWDGACITRWSPQAKCLQTIAMPVARPTSMTFGGADYRTLFITSARGGSMPRNQTRPSDAWREGIWRDDAWRCDSAQDEVRQEGGLFRVQVDVPGLPARAYVGKV
jgi:sugar lactone lactonase YvrE